MSRRVWTFFYGSYMNPDVLAEATQDELGRLYAHAGDVLGESYLAEAVLVQTRDLKWRPALCYIASGMERRSPEPAYVGRIVAAAKRFAFPRWYVDKLERFLQ